MKIRPKKVTPSIPQKTAVPRFWRISKPAPDATIRGTTPRMNAKLVMRMGRRRSLLASIAASRGDRPSFSRFSLANSTMRIAFLHERAISTTRPIWVKMLLSMPRKCTPQIAESRPSGTIRITASGRPQLSYWKASTRKTISTLRGKASLVNRSLPASICW